jgi:putative FmdB family regulatory protein
VPTYEYRCEHCDKTFDIVQSIHSDPLTECPTCGNPVRKVFGNVGIVFKGSGFYKNDSRSGGSSKSKGSSGSPSGSDSNGSSGGDSDSKGSSTDSTSKSSDGSSGSGSTATPKVPTSDSSKGS